MALVGNLGRSVTLPPDNRLRDVLSVTEDDGDGGASVISATLQIGNDTQGSSATDATIRARAQIEWGTGGAQHSAEIDVRPGLILSVPASFLRISVANESAIAGSSYVAFASASYLPRGGPSFVTRTVRRDTALAATATLNLAVPTAFIYDVDVRRTPNNAAYTLRFLDAAPNILYEMAVGAGSDPGPIRLAPEVTTVRIVNDATQIDRARAVFGMAL